MDAKGDSSDGVIRLTGQRYLQGNRLHLVVLGFTRLSRLYWSVLGCNERYLGALGCTGLYWAILEVMKCTGLYWAVLYFTGLHWVVLDSRGLQ